MATDYTARKAADLRTEVLQRRIPLHGRSKRQQFIDALEAHDNGNNDEARYGGVTAAELKAQCKKRGIVLQHGKTNKDDCRRALEDADDEAAEEAADDEVVGDRPADVTSATAAAGVTTGEANSAPADTTPEATEARRAEAARRPWMDFAAEVWRGMEDPMDTEELNNATENAEQAWDELSADDRDRILNALDAYGIRSAAFIAAEAEAKQSAAAVITLEEYTAGKYDAAKGPPSLRPTFHEHVPCLIRAADARDDLRKAIAALHGLIKNLDGIAEVVSYLEDIREDHDERSNQDTQHIDEWEERERDYRAAIRKDKASRLSPTLAGTFDSSWVGGWGTGEGSVGKVTTWVKQDSQGRIVDRLAVKDTYMIPEAWRRPEYWSPSPLEPLKQIPTEILAMYLLRSRIGSQHIVRIRNWRIRTGDMMHRIYMEFCPFSDAWELARMYEIGRNEVVTGEGSANPSSKPVWHPEPFLWHVFECLVVARLLLQYGELEENPVAHWTPLVHRDFKMENLFLAEAASDNFRGYPTAKLGDFGHAVFVGPSDSRLPSTIARAGTLDAMAPEQNHHKLAGEKELRPLSEKTNVYGISHTLWSTIMFGVGVDQYKADFGNEDPAKRVPGFWPMIRAEQVYSDELLDLILSCMSYSPEDRPTFKELMRAIRRYTGASARDNDLAQGLREVDPEGTGFRKYQEYSLPDVWSSAKGHDKFALGEELNDGAIPLPTGLQRFPSPPSGDGQDANEPGGRPGAEIDVPEHFSGPTTTGNDEHESRGTAAANGKKTGSRTQKGAEPRSSGNATKRKSPSGAGTSGEDSPAKRRSSARKGHS